MQTLTKYTVLIPWRKGQKRGETFETKKLHPALAGHVQKVEVEPVKVEPEKPKQEPRKQEKK